MNYISHSATNRKVTANGPFIKTTLGALDRLDRLAKNPSENYEYTASTIGSTPGRLSHQSAQQLRASQENRKSMRQQLMLFSPRLIQEIDEDEIHIERSRSMDGERNDKHAKMDQSWVMLQDDVKIIEIKRNQHSETFMEVGIAPQEATIDIDH